MATIAPFNGVRFAAGGDVSRFLAPPYDVISEREQRALCAQDPHNIIHLTLGAPRAGRRDYRSIGRRLGGWVREGVLVREPAECFYGYCQEYALDGVRLKFWGLLALIRLNEFGHGPVYPHEKVHPGPVDDRYRIMEATRANLEPIMTLYRAPSDPLELLYSSLDGLPPALCANLSNGTRHRVWRLSAAHTRSRIRRALRRHPLVIADGHHRYNSALMYWRRHRRAKSAGWMMSLVGNTEQKGLRILPINRIIRCAGPVTAGLPRTMSRFGRVERLGARFTRTLLRIPANTLGFFSRNAGAWLLHLPAPRPGAGAVESMEVSRLHEEVLPLTVEAREIVYTKRVAEDIDKAARNRSVLTCFLPSPQSSAVCTVAFGNGFMPQKSTFFMPKPQSGLVLRLIR